MKKKATKKFWGFCIGCGKEECIPGKKFGKKCDEKGW